MRKLHKLLQRQVNRHLSTDGEMEPQLVELFDRISTSYSEYEGKIDLLQTAIELNSDDLMATNREMATQNSELKYIYQIALLIHGHSSSRLVMPTVAKKIASATEFPVVAVELYNNKTNALHLSYLVGGNELGPTVEGKSLDITTTPYVQIFSDGADSYVSNDFHKDLFREPVWQTFEVASLISVAMRTGSHIWGTLTIGHREPGRASINLSKWLQTVAGQIAAKLETERLNDMNEQQQAFVLASSKMSELGKMAGGIAHEINTPLTTILLLTNLLAEQTHQQGLTAFAEPIDTIVKTVERIALIVRGLRTFSRDGSNDRFILTKFSSVIANTVALCNEKFKQSAVKLTVNCPNDLEIHCRETQVSQLLLNLMSNAYDAIKTFEQRWVAIDVEDLGPCIRIYVTDSGNGIPPEQREKLFMPFYTTKDVGEGTGLGLSITLGIVDAHSGRIEVDPEHPHTRFVIYLPKDPAAIRAKVA